MVIQTKNFIRTVALVVSCAFALPSTVWAQDVDLVDLPPQPAQVSPAENLVVEPPLSPLNDVQPEALNSKDSAQEQEPIIVPYSGAYYDADSIGPSSLGASAGPRKVDPKYEPGSSFIVVKKNASAGSRQANIVAAQRALKLGRYASALELYESLNKKRPKNKQVLMGLAVAQQYNGFTESAIATYEELLKVDARHTGAMVNLMGLLERHQPEVALRKLQDLWNRDGNNPAIAAQLGIVNAKLGNFEGASRYLGVAASLEPSNALHYYNLAIVLDRTKSHQSAIEYYQKALEVDIAHHEGGSIPREQVYDRLAQLRRL